jgi:peptidoglycan/LPS O-acetylase OafA/YrhL
MLASNVNLANTTDGTATLKSGSLDWLLVRTPLHVVWAGPEMVLIFFVLSGYVLALPAVSRGMRWFSISYYPRRLVRLYVPVWVSLLIGGLLHELHKSPVPNASWWLDEHAVALSLHDGLNDASLVHQGLPWAFTSVIWSLKYEVLFSLSLPAILAAALLVRRGRLLTLMSAAGCMSLMYVGAEHGNSDLRYLPLFVLGVLMAFHADRLRRVASMWLFPIALVLCVCLLTASYTLSGATSGGAPGFQYLADVLGSCAAVWIAIGFGPARKALSIRPLRWLGSRSYSLYLVHEPIVVAIAFMFRGVVSPVLLLAVAVPVSLLAAEIFWRSVESPSIRLARRLGQMTRTVGWGSVHLVTRLYRQTRLSDAASR